MLLPASMRLKAAELAGSGQHVCCGYGQQGRVRDGRESITPTKFRLGEDYVRTRRRAPFGNRSRAKNDDGPAPIRRCQVRCAGIR